MSGRPGGPLFGESYTGAALLRSARVAAGVRCPSCGFEGTEAEVDDHRASGIHNDGPQQGGNLRGRRG